MISLISLCKEVRKGLAKHTNWGVDSDLFNQHPESIWVYWKLCENYAWERTDRYVISFEVNEEVTKNYTMTIIKYLDLSSRENPEYKTREDGKRKFKIKELNDIDTVVANIKEEIPFRFSK